MTPTQEQTNILQAFQSGSTIIIQAGPGCGKSTTLGMLASTIPSTKHSTVAATAFNRDAVAALDAKLPSAIKAKTLNSLGAGIWRSVVGRTILEADKTKSIIADIRNAGRYSISPDEYSDILALVSMAKSQGYLPPKSGAIPLKSPPTFASICNQADLRPSSYLELILNLILTQSIKSAFEGLIDFDDQIYMPALFAPSEAYPPCQTLIVDEAQDLTPLQLRLLQRLKPAQAVFVGDPLQAIYGFRGAMSDSMEQISKLWPEAITLPLQTSFRIPSEIVELLHSHNPALTTTKSEGEINDWTGMPDTNTLKNWLSTGTQGQTKAILCRNNAPLYRVALACIASKIPYHMANKAFGLGLVKAIKKVSRPTDPAARLPNLLGSYWSYDDPNVEDKLATISLLAERNSTVADLIKDIQSLNTQSNLSDSAHPLFLSTAHKAKGLEFQWVCHLDPHLIPAKFATTPEALKQEANIDYVINSRSLHTLIFLSSDQILIPGGAAARERPDTRKSQPW